MRHRVLIIGIMLTIVTAMAVMFALRLRSGSIGYSFGNPGCLDCLLNPAEDRLYVSYYDDNEVIELDVAQMVETRSFDVEAPTFMAMEQSGQHLYVMSDVWPGVLCRICLEDGQMSQLQLEGGVAGLFIDDSENRLWLLHRLYPEPDDSISEEAAVQVENQISGRLSEVNIEDFSIVRTISIPTLPMSIMHSPYSDHLYIMHEFRRVVHELNMLGGSVLYILDAQTLDELGDDTWGKIDIVAFIPAVPSNWSDDGRYLAFPNPGHGYPEFSIRVFDTADDTVAFDLSFPDVNSEPLGIKYIHKVPGCDVLWAAVQQRIPAGFPEGVNAVIRIDTSTQQYEIFEVEGERSAFADFAVSPDGGTLYLTHPWTGEIIKWTAPNSLPICDFYVVTPIPYLGPSPALIEFDASASFDRDPCDELTYEWDFDGDRIFSEPVDDSYTGDPVNPTHEYTSDYNGPVHLRVTDPHQASSECLKLVIVDII